MPSPELYKDKVEVSLDGRQIFYLFFGGAVIVGIVFVLGVLVGRRVEARGHVDRARTTAAADPLAALDRLEGSGEMAFRGALTGKEATAPVEKKIEQLAADKKKTEAAPSAKKAEATKDEAKKEEAKTEEAKKAEAKKAEAKKDEATKAETKAEAKKTEATKDEAARTEAMKDDKKEVAVEPAKEEKTRYTLQLSSFQDKAEAEAYLAKMKEQGFQAQITQAEVEGKGTFYRVRMGTYRSLDAATTAKADFEKSSSKSASIMKL